MDLKSLGNSELLIKYGEWYLKYQATSSDKKKDECLSVLFEFTREILNRMGDSK